MPDSLNQNPWQNQQAPGMPKVAPPPVEVAIRTMASDIASMAQSGGGPPRPQSVILPPFSVEQEEDKRESPVPPKEIASHPPRETAPQEKTVSEEREGVPGAPMGKYLMLAASILVAAVAIFFGSYYVLYPLVNRLKSKAPAVPLQASTAPSAQAQPSIEHHSFFKQAVDGTFSLKISSSNAGLQDSSQQLGQFLVGLSATSTFFEIQPQSSDDQPLSANDFFSSISGGVLDSNFLASAFNPDFTVFLYKDKNGLAGQAGLWPGYILQLKANQTPLLLKPDAAKVESASSNWQNLFLQSPGAPAGVFRDAILSGQPVRVLNFSDGKSVLAYGWFFNKYLIISTSLDGLKQAIQHF